MNTLDFKENKMLKLPLLALSLGLLLAISTTGSIAAESEELRSQYHSLIQDLGYGRGIHNFKNLIIRGQVRYADAATADFLSVENTIQVLKNDSSLPANKLAALNDLLTVVGQYKDAVLTAKQLIDEGKTPSEIDAVIKISDGPAIDALMVLREGIVWSVFEDLEFTLGYGGAIHNVKNYVLRGADRHKIAADTAYAKALLIIDEIVQETRPNSEMEGDVAVLVGVINDYQDALVTTQQMYSEGKTPTEIDAAIKINDGPAIAALQALGELF